MGTFQIISAVLLIVSCIALIFFVLMQEPKGNGLSSAIAGSGAMRGESRFRTADAQLAGYTKVAAAALFVLTLIVDLVAIFAK